MTVFFFFSVIVTIMFVINVSFSERTYTLALSITISHNNSNNMFYYCGRCVVRSTISWQSTAQGLPSVSTICKVHIVVYFNTVPVM